MAEFFARKENRFRKLSQDEVELPGVFPWLGIEFKEMGGLAVKKFYVTDGSQTFEIHKAPPLSGGPYIYQVLQEITPKEHPFLHSLIADEFGKL